MSSTMRWVAPMSMRKLLAQPRLQQTSGDIAAGFLVRSERAPVMIAADALVSLVGTADGSINVADHRRKARRIARVFDEQRGLRDAGSRPGERRVRRQAGPGGQPAFRGADAGETH